MQNNLLQLGRACLVSLFIAGLKFLAEYRMEVGPQTFFRITPRPFLSYIPFFLIFFREDTGKTRQEYSNPCQSTETIFVVNCSVVFLFTAFIVELWKLHASTFSQAHMQKDMQAYNQSKQSIQLLQEYCKNVDPTLLCTRLCRCI